MKSILFAGSLWAATALFATASAADLPPPVQPPESPVQAFSWHGYYVGGHLGYGQTIDDKVGIRQFPTRSIRTLGGNLRPGGPLLGLQLGRNWQNDKIVFGVEASATLLTGSATYSNVYPAPFNTRITTGVSKDWTASLRGRLGIAQGRTLYYLTGGLALTDVKYKLTPVGGTPFSTVNVRPGPVVGLGIEHAFGNNWSARLEGLFTRTPKSIIGVTPCCGGSIRTLETQSHWQVRLGVNYLFNTPGGAIVAKF